MKDQCSSQKDSCHLEFACIGCNRTTEALSWGKCGLICFGACNSVVIYNPIIKASSGKLLAILNGHKARVNCVQWLKSEDENDLEIVSGSSDNSIILWEGKIGKWIVKQVLSGHSKMVCTLASTCFVAENGENNSFCVSGSTDFSFKFWSRYGDDKEFQCCQSVSFGNGFVHSVAITCLPQTNDVILA